MPYPKKLPSSVEITTLRQSLSSQEIADIYGVSVTAVNKALRKAGNTHRSTSSVDEIHDLNRYLSLTEIASRLGVSKQAISERLKRAGYKPIRHRPRTEQPLPCDEEIVAMYQQLPLEIMSNTLGISVKRISKRLDELGVSRNLHYGKGGQRSMLPDSAVLKKLRQSLSVAQIATMYDVTKPAVYAALRRR